MTPNNKKPSEKALLRELHFEYRMIKERNRDLNIKIEREIDDCKLQISAYSMKGKRCHMEDFYDIGYLMKPAEQQKPNEWPYEFFYFGVFDGHGGREAASFAKKNLLNAIISQPKFWSECDDDILQAIKAGFADTHAAMKEDMPNWTRTKWALPSTAGTTASVLFIKNGKFYTGHVGDSRIVISKKNPETKDWHNEDLTVDQKPENETERIEAAGGQVRNKIGVHRVVWHRPIFNNFIEQMLRDGDPKSQDYLYWQKSTSTYPIHEAAVRSYQIIPFLAIARSLGDFWSINRHTGVYMVSPEPDVACRPIDKNDKCILLATDGLWNVMSSSQAVRYLQELKVVKKDKRNKDKHSNKYFGTDNYYDLSIANHESNHALSLVYTAYQIWERRRLRSDNITAVVAMLGDLIQPIGKQDNGVTSETPSIKSATSSQPDWNYIQSNTKQLGDTKLFFQNISLAQKADFKSFPDTYFECELLENLEHFLVFPPTVFGDVLPYLKPPRNYKRLADAKTRKLERDQTTGQDRTDSYIYIKEVSDDPADAIKSPARINKKGKEVRDSSAQATQAMHDFGQPWDQLINDQPSLKKAIIPRRYHMRVATEAKMESDPVFFEADSDSDEEVVSDEDYELVFESDLKEGDVVIMEDRSDEDEFDDDDEFYDNMKEALNGEEAVDNDDGQQPEINNALGFVNLTSDKEAWSRRRADQDCNEKGAKTNEPVTSGSEPCRRQTRSSSKARSDDESDTDLAVEQVLSVVSENKTPPSNRLTRRSATENSKRKHETTDEPSPKSKRRRSHPIQTVVPTRV